MLMSLNFFPSICKIFYFLARQLAIICNRLPRLEIFVVVFNFTLHSDTKKYNFIKFTDRHQSNIRLKKLTSLALKT